MTDTDATINTLQAASTPARPDISLETAIEMSRFYAKMGFAVQEQLDSLIEMGVDEAFECGHISTSGLQDIMDYLASLRTICSESDYLFEEVETWLAENA